MKPLVVFQSHLRNVLSFKEGEIVSCLMRVQEAYEEREGAKYGVPVVVGREAR